MKRIVLLALFVLTCISCQKKLPTEVMSNTNRPPEEPLQRLAWDASQQISSRLTPGSIKVGTIENRSSLPGSSLHYFRGALENELWRKKIQDNPSLTVNGILTYANGQLQFFWETVDDPKGPVSGMTAILWSEPPADTATHPEEHHAEGSEHQHKEVAIPTPVAQLQSIPLDVNQICVENQEACELVVLYDDSVERINWKSGNKRKMTIAPEHFSNIRSRAPSGKILPLSGTYLVLNNNLNYPLQFDSNFDQPSPAYQSTHIPRPAQGLNTFLLMNGRFYDFEFLNPKGIAVIQDNQRLSIGTGTLSSANETVGSSLAVIGSAIYTSSPSLPQQPDSVMKFIYENSSLVMTSKVAVEGEILDLAATDLNRDGISELLVSVRVKDQIYIDVLEAF